MEFMIKLFAVLGLLVTIGVIYVAIKERNHTSGEEILAEFYERKAIAHSIVDQVNKKYTEILSQYPDIKTVTLGQIEEAYNLAVHSVEKDESIMMEFHFLLSNSLEYNIRLMDRYKNKETNNE